MQRLVRIGHTLFDFKHKFWLSYANTNKVVTANFTAFAWI